MSIVEFLMLGLALGLLARAVLSTGKNRLRVDPSLCDAASVGDRPKLERLLTGGVDPNSADEDGLTALDYAESYDSSNLAELRKG